MAHMTSSYLGYKKNQIMHVVTDTLLVNMVQTMQFWHLCYEKNVSRKGN